MIKFISSNRCVISSFYFVHGTVGHNLLQVDCLINSAWWAIYATLLIVNIVRRNKLTGIEASNLVFFITVKTLTLLLMRQGISTEAFEYLRSLGFTIFKPVHQLLKQKKGVQVSNDTIVSNRWYWLPSTRDPLSPRSQMVWSLSVYTFL